MSHEAGLSNARSVCSSVAYTTQNSQTYPTTARRLTVGYQFSLWNKELMAHGVLLIRKNGDTAALRTIQTISPVIAKALERGGDSGVTSKKMQLRVQTNVARWAGTVILHTGSDRESVTKAISLGFVRPPGGLEFKRYGNPSPNTGTSNFVRRAGLAEGGPDQPNSDYAKAHANNGGGSHDVGPKGGLPLGYKIGLIILVLGLCIFGFLKAFDAFEMGDADTGLGYLVASVAGIIVGLSSGLPFILGGL